MSQASRTATCRVAVLGPVLVESAAGDPVEPGGATAKALVVSLALARGALSVRGIADDLWQDAPPRNEKAALQTLVSRVRSVAVDGLIDSTPGGYALGSSGDPHRDDECAEGGQHHRSDLAAATRAGHDARAAIEHGDWHEAEARASAGLKLWRGEPGADLGESELAERLVSVAAALHRELMLQRATARVEAGDAREALADLARLAEAAPLDETVELLRLRAIAATGRTNDAIREFGEFRERLRDELGTDPSADLIAFNAGLLRAQPPSRGLSIGFAARSEPASGAQTTTEPARTLRVGIRVPPNELVGRDDDIAAVEELMASARLTTILGAGGLGKTRLAQALAARAAAGVEEEPRSTSGSGAMRMPGVVVVELASVRTGDDVPLALASTLGIREFTGTRLTLSDPAVRVDVRARILGALDERPTLLVMDNCEHLIDAAAEWIADILASTRGVRVLATSRSPLMIAAEQVYQLEPLPAIAEGDAGALPGPAVALFIERARAARPSVVLPTETIERLCAKLDGLPLAIELAAARVRSMSVEEIERRIGNRFALLRGGDRAAPERHRTLLAVIDWSWNLLRGSEQRTLRRLSMFVDGFSADAAAAVCGSPDDVEEDLEGLVNQSLLSAVESPHTGRVRYRMLETVREFGDQRLQEAGEVDDVAASIRAWADAFALAVLDATYGAEQVATFHRVEEEQDNLVAALRDAIAVADAPTTAGVFAALGMHWTLRGAHSEVTGLAPQVLPVLRRYEPDQSHRDAAMVSLGMIGATSLIYDARQGIRSIVRLRRLHARGPARDPQLNAMLSLLVVMPVLSDAMDVVRQLCTSHDPAVASFGLIIESQLMENSGRTGEAIAACEQAYEKAQITKDVWTLGMAAHNLAQLHSERGDSTEVVGWATVARSNLERLNAGEDLRQLDWLVAVNDLALGRHEEARIVFDQLSRLQGDQDSFDWNDLKAIGFAGLAEIAGAEGNLEQSRRLYGVAERTWGDPPGGFAPWYYGAAAGYLVASVRIGARDDPRTRLVARRLRSRLLRDDRVRPGMIDRPITGVGVIGLGMWLLATTGDDPDASMWRASGLELLALARGIHARRDFPSLDPERSLGDTRSAHPELDVDAVTARVDAMTLDERAARVIEVVRSLRPLFV
ncbi:BTAD domain-containing putative transcriptional regulator [Humibacter antri]